MMVLRFTKLPVDWALGSTYCFLSVARSSSIPETIGGICEVQDHNDCRSATTPPVL